MHEIRLIRSTDAATEPVSAADFRAWARVSDTSEDTLIDALIKTARYWTEKFTRRALITQTWKLYLDSFPSCGEITLFYPKIQSVTSIEYYDTDGALQTFSSGDYQLDIISEPGRIVLAPDAVFPSTETGKINAVIVTYVAGYGAASAIPETIKTAMKQLVAHMFEHRESHSDGFEVKEVPMTCEYLLWPYRIMRL